MTDLSEFGADDVVDERTGDLVLDDQHPADATAEIVLDEDATVARSSADNPGVWADLVKQSGFQTALLEGVRRFADGRTSSELQEALEARDVAYPLRSVIERLARGVATAWQRGLPVEVPDTAPAPRHDEARFDARSDLVVFRREGTLTTCYGLAPARLISGLCRKD